MISPLLDNNTTPFSFNYEQEKEEIDLHKIEGTSRIVQTIPYCLFLYIERKNPPSEEDDIPFFDHSKDNSARLIFLPIKLIELFLF